VQNPSQALLTAAGRQIRAEEMTYNEMYNAALTRGLGDSADIYKERAKVVSEALLAKTGVRMGPEEIWTASKVHCCTKKTADLFWNCCMTRSCAEKDSTGDLRKHKSAQ
jgi:hypothetical protein